MSEDTNTRGIDEPVSETNGTERSPLTTGLGNPVPDDQHSRRAGSQGRRFVEGSSAVGQAQFREVAR